MSFETLPITARTLKATEARLKSIYDASRLGLTGDSLALAAGMLPVEYRRLCEVDPLASLAAQKGKADSEADMAGVVRDAALAGDAKIALEFLKHRHDWVAKQAVSVEVNQTISVIAALQAAEQRVIEGAIISETPARANEPGLLVNNREKDGRDYEYLNARAPENATSL